MILNPQTAFQQLIQRQKKLAAGDPCTGYQTLASVIGTDAAAKVSEWLNLPNAKLGEAREPIYPIAGQTDEFTDAGNAKRFANEHHNQWVYSIEDGKWYCWSGQKWVPRNDEILRKEFIEVIKRIGSDPHAKEVAVNHSKKSLSRNRMEGTSNNTVLTR